MEFLVCNDIATSEHDLSTKLEGYFGVLWAELSIWAVQWHFWVFGELILRQPSQQKLPFLSTPHSCTVLNFCQNALKTFESKFIMLPGHPHRVVVASLNSCRWGVSCNARTGREWESYNLGDKGCQYLDYGWQQANRFPIDLPIRWNIIDPLLSSFPESSCYRVAVSFTEKGCQFFDCGYQQANCFPIDLPTRPEIIDTVLRLICWMGLLPCHFFIYRERLPILWWWISASKSLPNWVTDNANIHWRSVDAHYLKGAVNVSLSHLPRKAANTSIMQNTEQVASQLTYLQDQNLLTLCWCSFPGRGC